jgi:hypothetical protein
LTPKSITIIVIDLNSLIALPSIFRNWQKQFSASSTLSPISLKSNCSYGDIILPSISLRIYTHKSRARAQSYLTILIYFPNTFVFHLWDAFTPVH